MMKFDGGPVAIDQYSILVVDDNANNSELINRYMSKKGYNVTTVSNGRDALAINHIERFDLILLDILMPDIDGLAVLKKLKAKAGTCNIPVIMLTASNDSEYIRQANELYVDDFIIKSESLKSIRERILTVLQNRRIFGTELTEPTPEPHNNARLLVVDDDVMSRELLFRRIKKFGYNVDTAESGEDALDMLKKTKYDLVFLDVVMPDLSGIELLEIMKTSNQFKSTSVIMVSANSDDQVIKHCQDLGAKDYVVKPFHYSLLKNTIETTISIHQ
jgi:DNA-binding response OmpR family regulator